MPRVVIVGAGISGLALAYRLQQTIPNADVTVLESASRSGGKIGTVQAEGFRFEIGPNGFLDSKPSTVCLCSDLGLSDRLISASESASKNRYLFLDGKLCLLPGSLGDFLRSDLLSWRGKLSFFAEFFRRRRKTSADESIDAFARRRAGAEAAEVFADALVTGIHAGDPALLSMKAAFPRLTSLEEQYGSFLRGLKRTAKQRRAEAKAQGKPAPGPARMWAFREGLGLLIDTLVERLSRPPVFGVNVQRLERGSDDLPWIVHGGGRDSWLADVVVLACPAPQQAAILADVDSQLSVRVSSIPYNRIVVAALGFRKAEVPVSLEGFGYIAPQRTRRDLLGVQWCSSIFPDRAPPGMTMLRALCGGWNRPEIVGWDDRRLLEAVRQELRLAMGIQAEPVFVRVVRWDQAIPQYHLGHSESVAWIESRLSAYPGLFLAGNAYHGIAVNDCTEQAELLAARVRQFLQ